MSTTATHEHTEHGDPVGHAEAPPAAVQRSKPLRALVVGASSGIGEALVKQLVSEGATVVAVARRKAMLQELAAQSHGRVIALAHDVTSFAEVPVLFESAVRDLGGLDLFIYAAGIMPEIRADEFDTSKDLDTLAVNLGGCIAWTNEVAKLFRTQRAGVIVGISSIAGE